MFLHSQNLKKVTEFDFYCCPQMHSCAYSGYLYISQSFSLSCGEAVLNLKVQECNRNTLVFVRSFSLSTACIISDHLANRLHIDSSLMKSSMWDVESRSDLVDTTDLAESSSWTAAEFEKPRFTTCGMC